MFQEVHKLHHNCEPTFYILFGKLTDGKDYRINRHTVQFNTGRIQQLPGAKEIILG